VDGARWYEIPNPNYSGQEWGGHERLAAAGGAGSPVLRWAPLARSGVWQVRSVLFPRDTWADRESCERWVQEHREELVVTTVTNLMVKTVTLKADGFGPEPTEDQMELINEYALEPLTPDQVYTRRMRLANDQWDRSLERFSRGTLRALAKTIIGKSVMEGHDHGRAPLGRFYDARVGKDPKGENDWQWLNAYWYTVKTAANEPMRQSIDAGVWRDVSIGFFYEWMQCSICQENYMDENKCPHIKGNRYPLEECVDPSDTPLTEDGSQAICGVIYRGKAEAVEGSFVYLGAQYGAEVVKAAMSGDLVAAKKLKLGEEEPEVSQARKARLVVPGLDSDAKPEGKMSEGAHIGTPHRLPPAPEDARWNPDGVSEAQIIHTILGNWQNDREPNWDNAKKCNVYWRDPGDRINDYKLKVARRDPIRNDGRLKLFWRQVASRMAILFGARGGVDIPREDRRACYDELVRCYKVFDKEPPEFKIADQQMGLDAFIDLTGSWPDLDHVVFRAGEFGILATGAGPDPGGGTDMAGKGADTMDDAQVKELQEALEAEKAKAEEAQKAAEHSAKEAAALRARVVEDVVRLAGVLKREAELETLQAAFGEDLASMPAEKLLELQSRWQKLWDEERPHGQQSDPGDSADSADDETVVTVTGPLMA